MRLDFLPGGSAAATPAEDLARSFARLMRSLHLQGGGAATAAGGVERAARLASLAVAEGHVCAELAGESADWLAELRASPVVDADRPEAFRPLVLDAAGRLYLHRYWRHEWALARRLAALDAPAPLADEAAREAVLDALFPPPDGGPDRQREAAQRALSRRLTVISGGPGTGKTTTLVRLLAAALRLQPNLRARLAAPTGKAAARMQEAVRRQLAGLALSAQQRRGFPDSAATLHRLLGARPGRVGFRHDAAHPLACDLLIVDEASMLDLALAARLLEALPRHARLVLVGDRDQLASVEAGAVFGQICGGAQSPALENAVAVLERSFRFSGGIGELAGQVNAGAADAALALLTGGACAELAWHESGTGADGLAPGLLEGYAAFIDALRRGAAAAEVLAAFEGYRVLAALREGARGTLRLNEALGAALRRALGGEAARGARWYAGRPVIVNRNDYALRLYNGDIGVALPQGDGQLLVHFPAEGGTRAIAPGRLPDCETALALTVHKAQGSEFERVDLVLPDQDSRVLTRELIYTALTRARSRLRVWGREAVFAAALQRVTARSSGLAQRLASAAGGA